MASLAEIQDFLGARNPSPSPVFAQPEDFTRMLFREFRDRGYDVVPVTRTSPTWTASRASRTLPISTRRPKPRCS